MKLFASPDVKIRLSATRKCGNILAAQFLDLISTIGESDPIPKVRHAALESVNLIHLGGEDSAKALAAASALGDLRSARGLVFLEEVLTEYDAKEKAGEAVDSNARAVYAKAIDDIEGYQRAIRGAEHLFSGLSRGSVLVLMARF